MGQEQNKPTAAGQPEWPRRRPERLEDLAFRLSQARQREAGSGKREAKLLTGAIDRAKGQQFQETSRNFLQQEQDEEK